MSTVIEERILRWNKERGFLDGNFDPNLELKMLSEELHEFMVAEEYAHMLQEAADFIFVAFGTAAKHNAVIFKSAAQFDLHMEGYSKLADWIKESTKTMHERLTEAAPEGYHNLWSDHLSKAFLFVTEANEAKPTTKDEDGKVIKGDDYVSPLARIREYLKDQGVIE